MEVIATCLFLIGCTIQIIIVLRQPKGQYQFPFFMIAISMLYFGTQMVLFTLNEGQNFSAEIALFALMATLVNIAIHIGFAHGARRKSTGDISFPSKKIRTFFPFLLNLFFFLAATQAFIRLSAMSGGAAAFFDTAGAGIVWEGEAVRYTVAIQSLYFVYPTCLFIWRATGNRAFLVLGCCALVLPILYAVMLNRRFVFFLLATSFYLFLFFQYRIIIRKALIVFAAPFSMSVVTLFPFLRSADGFWDAIESSGLTGIGLIAGRTFGEVRNGALVLMTSFYNGEYEYGLGFLTQIVRDFVPSSVIGRETKNQLVGEDWVRDLVYSDYSITVPTHEFVTGVAAGFVQLAWLSLVMWYLIGLYFGKLWTLALKRGDLKSQVMYTVMIPTGMMALYYAPEPALSQTIKIWVIVNLSFVFTRLVVKSKSAPLSP